MDGQDYVLTIKGSPHAEKIRRSLTTLFDTRESSQPGDRDFGLSWQCLDEPPEVAESMMAMEIIRKVERYEPEAEVEDITYEYTEGKMVPHILITGKEGQNE